MAIGSKYFGALIDPNYKNASAYLTVTFGSAQHSKGNVNIPGTQNLPDGIYRVDLSMINLKSASGYITPDFGTTSFFTHLPSSDKDAVLPTLRTYIVRIDKGLNKYVFFNVRTDDKFRSSVWSFEYLSAL